MTTRENLIRIVLLGVAVLAGVGVYAARDRLAAQGPLAGAALVLAGGVFVFLTATAIPRRETGPGPTDDSTLTAFVTDQRGAPLTHVVLQGPDGDTRPADYSGRVSFPRKWAGHGVQVRDEKTLRTLLEMQLPDGLSAPDGLPIVVPRATA